MADIHSHILPRMDDGSRSPEESVAMLEESFRQGVRQMVATPHFYPTEDHPEDFLKRRAESIRVLSGSLQGQSIPTVYVGAEVAYYFGMGKSEFLKDFCISGTNFLLVEMPFDSFTDTMLEDLRLIIERQHLHPILAHIERYLDFQKKGTIDKLPEMGCILQSNASFFLNAKTERKAFHMLKQGSIGLLGTDCHNMEYRAPNMGEAVRKICAAGDLEYLLPIASLSSGILNKAVPIL